MRQLADGVCYGELSIASHHIPSNTESVTTAAQLDFYSHLIPCVLGVSTMHVDTLLSVLQSEITAEQRLCLTECADEPELLPSF
jgi:hypothetical protein